MNTDEAEGPIEEVKYVATLVRGNYHGLRDLSWENGRSVVISETQMIHLEEHAVDHVGTSDGETLSKDRFEFEHYEGEHPVGYKFPTEAEAAAKEAAEKARERSRRLAIAKASIDEQPQPAPRSRVRPSATRR